MKNLSNVVKKSQEIGRTASRLPLYYSISDDAVYTEDGTGRHLVTYLIRPNTSEEIKAAVLRWKSM